jgi:transglutaminase-like putative cysteine protease
MNSYFVYRASFYLMLVVSTLALSGDNPEGQYAKILGIVVAVAGAVAFFTVDVRQRWALPRRLADALALGTLVVLYFEYRNDESQRISALAHWLVYLQLIKYFLPKTAEDDWFLFLLGLIQVLIGSVINQSDEVGAWLCLWALLAVWVLGQFFLQREARRFSLAPVQPATRRAGAPVVDPYHGLFDLPYAAATIRVMFTTLALGGLIFLVLPRQAGANRTQANAVMPRHLTGFDEEVQLGQLGEILENDSVVMTVELTDQDGHPLRLEEPLWRGVTMIQYDGGRWHRQTRGTQSIVGYETRRARAPREIHQKIKLEPIDSQALFAMRPILEVLRAENSKVVPSTSTNDGTLYRPDKPNSPYDYEVVSSADIDDPQPHESPPSSYSLLNLSMPPKLKARLRKIAEPIVAKIPADGQAGIEARARALADWLRDSGEFSYTLQMSAPDPSLDPVEDFLTKRKAGHCEYFASALALLLRSIDIQSRVVNGFKGGDWNDLIGTINVRQKHAHSWVEAYVGLHVAESNSRESGNESPSSAGPHPGDRAPIWITLDPTPAAERRKSIAQVGGLAAHFRALTDSIRHVWVFYIVGYDADRQNRLVYTPMRTIIIEARRKYAELGLWLRRSVARQLYFQNMSAFISVRGLLVTFFALITTVALARVVFRIARRIASWLRGPALDATSLAAGTLFYRRLTQMLAAYDLERTPAETQNEFAIRAHKFLTGHGPGTAGISDVPEQVVSAFYRVRFGHLELAPGSLQELNARLDSLESRLKSP